MALRQDLLSRLAENARLLEEEEKAKQEIGATKPIGTTKQELSLIPEKKFEVPSGPMSIEPGALPYTGKAIATARSLQKELPQETFEGIKPLEKIIESTNQLNEKRAQQAADLGAALEKEASVKPASEISVDELIAKVGIKKRGQETPAWIRGLLDAAVAAVPIITAQALAGGNKYGRGAAIYAGGLGATAGLESLEKARKEEREAARGIEDLVIKSELESLMAERKLPGKMQELRFKAYQDRMSFLDEAMLKGEISKEKAMEEASKLIADAEKRFTSNQVELLKAGLSAAKPREFAPPSAEDKAKSEDIIFGEGRYVLPVKAQAQIQQKKRIDEFREQASSLKDMQDAITTAYNVVKGGRKLNPNENSIYNQALNRAIMGAKTYFSLGQNFTGSEQERVFAFLGSDPNRPVIEIIKEKWAGNPMLNAKALARAHRDLQKEYERKIKGFGAVINEEQKPAATAPSPKSQTGAPKKTAASAGPTREQMIEALKKGKQ